MQNVKREVHKAKAWQTFVGTSAARLYSYKQQGTHNHSSTPHVSFEAILAPQQLRCAVQGSAFTSEQQDTRVQ